LLQQWKLRVNYG